MNAIEQKHFDAIFSSVKEDLVSVDFYKVDYEKASKSCTEITIEEMKGFYEWARNERYEKYWGNDGPNNGKWYVGYTPPSRQYFTTEELITKYIDSLNK